MSEDDEWVKNLQLRPRWGRENREFEQYDQRKNLLTQRKQEKKIGKKDGCPISLKRDKSGVYTITSRSQVLFYIVRQGILNPTKVNRENSRVCQLEADKSVGKIIYIRQTTQGSVKGVTQGILGVTYYEKLCMEFLRNPEVGRFQA